MNISKELSKSEILCFYFLFVVGVSISKFALSASSWACWQGGLASGVIRYMLKGNKHPRFLYFKKILA